MTATSNQPVSQSLARYAPAIAKLFLIVGLSLALALTAFLSPWEGQLRTSRGRYLIRLPDSPLWQPPAMPRYNLFVKSFGQVPVVQSPDSAIVRVFLWQLALLRLWGYAWIVTCVIGTLYMHTCRRRDIVLHHVFHIALGMTSGAAACIALWTLIGGWGAPFPVLFGLLGIASGIVLGMYRLQSPKELPPTD